MTSLRTRSMSSGRTCLGQRSSSRLAPMIPPSSGRLRTRRCKLPSTTHSPLGHRESCIGYPRLARWKITSRATNEVVASLADILCRPPAQG
jgi:hypothetical protein